MQLEQLIQQKFAPLRSLLRAAASGKYIEGRDNVGIYALPSSRKTPDILEAFQLYGFGDIVQEAIAQELEREERVKDSVLIRGPLNNDMLVNLWLACRYFVQDTTDFKITDHDLINDWKYKIEIKSPSSPDTPSILMIRDEHFISTIRGRLPGDRFFRLSIARAPEMILPGCLDNMNDFSFETYKMTDGDYVHDNEFDFDVHLNGPENHVVMTDLMTLGDAIKDYCERKSSK